MMPAVCSATTKTNPNCSLYGFWLVIKIDCVVWQEMVLQMAMGGGGTYKPAPAIPRLGISAYQYDTECLHGIQSLDTTAFPQSLGLSASFRFVFSFANKIEPSANDDSFFCALIFSICYVTAGSKILMYYQNIR